MTNTIDDLKQIDTSTNEGQYLMAALALITTTSRTDKTPYEVLDELTILKNKMYPGIVVSNGITSTEDPFGK